MWSISPNPLPTTQVPNLIPAAYWALLLRVLLCADRPVWENAVFEFDVRKLSTLRVEISLGRGNDILSTVIFDISVATLDIDDQLDLTRTLSLLLFAVSCSQRKRNAFPAPSRPRSCTRRSKVPNPQPRAPTDANPRTLWDFLKVRQTNLRECYLSSFVEKPEKGRKRSGSLTYFPYLPVFLSSLFTTMS